MRDDRAWGNRLGWYFFLAFVAVTPFVLGALPPQVGQIALIRAREAVNLPKVVLFLVLSGLSLAALCVSVIRGEARLRWHPVLWLLVAVFGWAGVSTVFSPSPALSIWGAYVRYEGLAAAFGYALIAFLAVQYVDSIPRLRTVMAAAVFSGCVVSVYALFQWGGFDVFEWVGEQGRPMGTFGNADMLGAYLVFPLALALGLALSSRGTKPSMGWWSAAALILTALIASLTRGAWFGALIMVPALVFVMWRDALAASRWRRAIFGALVVAAVGLMAFAALFVRARVAEDSTALSSVLAALTSGRSEIWLAGLRAWLTHPVVGWGPDAFERAFDSAVGADWYRLVGTNVRADNAHNLFVQMLVTLGVPGLVLTVWALGQSAVESFRGLRRSAGQDLALRAGLWAALIGLTVALMSSVICNEVSMWLWLTVGLLVAPAARPVVVSMPRAALVSAAVAGIAVALWAGSWFVADVFAGSALKKEVGAARELGLERAARINPLAHEYRQLLADSLVERGLAEQRFGRGQDVVTQTMQRALEERRRVVAADPANASGHVDLAGILISFAGKNPASPSAAEAVAVAETARSLAPYRADVLVMLARAYETAGRLTEAHAVARVARSVAPEYSMQTLGTLGLETTSTP